MNQTKINNISDTDSGVSYDEVKISIENTLSDKIDITISEKLEEPDEVQVLLQTKKNNAKSVIELSRKIERLKQDNKRIERELWNKCEHVWERDWDVPFDDRCKYYCSVCKLWRNPHLYR